MAIQNGAKTPSVNLGDAATWATNAASAGIPVNGTPAVGAVAQWNAGAGGAGAPGHVDYVEAVGTTSGATTITVSEDNYATGPFTWKTITSGGTDWPSNFIHFADVTTPSSPSTLVMLQGSTVSAKAGLGTAWTTLLSSGAADIQAAGTRIAYRDSSGTLFAKDGLNGAWLNMAGGVTQYTLTASTLVIRQGSSIKAKAGLNDNWTVLVSADAVDERASGDRIAYLDSSGTLRVKDTINGMWYNEFTGVSQYDLSTSMLVIRLGGSLLAKVNLNDSWTTILSAGAADVHVSGPRIAYLDTANTLYAKDGISGTWYNEASNVSQFAVTYSMLAMRQGGMASAKANLNDAWTTILASGTADIQVGAADIALLDSGGTLWAKDQINTAWYNEASGVSQFALAG